MQECIENALDDFDLIGDRNKVVIDLFVAVGDR